VQGQVFYEGKARLNVTIVLPAMHIEPAKVDVYRGDGFGAGKSAGSILATLELHNGKGVAATVRSLFLDLAPGVHAISAVAHDVATSSPGPVTTTFVRVLKASDETDGNDVDECAPVPAGADASVEILRSSLQKCVGAFEEMGVNIRIFLLYFATNTRYSRAAIDTHFI
jgi:hypothetical protein